MSDPIERQAAIDAADKIIARDESGNNDVAKALRAWKAYIKALPSAQPEIIRCEDCKHYEADIMGNPWGVCCHPDWITDNCGNLVDESGWCYRAERRGE